MRALLEGLPYRVVPPGHEGFHLSPVDETGRTFIANATLKAIAASSADAAGRWALADDSGLEVEALAGAPGVRSARFAPVATDQDKANTTLLLERMRQVPDDARRARFTCCVVVASGNRVLASATGHVQGLILQQPRGEGGFGYDPIFFHPPSGLSFAEMSRAAKAAVSHRGRALRTMRQALREAAGGGAGHGDPTCS